MKITSNLKAGQNVAGMITQPPPPQDTTSGYVRDSSLNDLFMGSNGMKVEDPISFQ